MRQITNISKSTVVVLKCLDYNEEKLYTQLKKGIQLLGGIEKFALPNEKILIKPNLLVADSIEKATTTHPNVFAAIGKIFKESGAKLFYGDSPAFGKPERVIRKTGFKEKADQLGIQWSDFKKGKTVSFPDAMLAKQLYLAEDVLDKDGMISISKMKTHGFTRITGAVKNQFGCIPGLRKAEYHVKMPEVYKFSRVMVDINRYLNPRLYIMDGIIAMEGNGPSGGEPIQMKVLLLSKDPVAIDAVCCRLIDLNPKFVPTNIVGYEGKLGTYKENEIEIIGDDINGLINENFQVVRRPPERLTASRYYPTLLKNYISPRPIIDKEKCVKCGHCILQCPVEKKAVNWPRGNNKEVPVYNYKSCIRCYCCQEICPEKAIFIKIPPLGRLIYR